MRILSIDGSTKRTGWSIFDGNKLESYGVISASSTDLIKRIKKMINELDTILFTHKIDKLVIEEVLPDNSNKDDDYQKHLKNIKTMKALMYLQAAIIFLVHEHYNSIEIEFMYPSEWRKICGIENGRGIRRERAKQADIDFVKKHFGITVSDDEADAIAIGYASINNIKNELNW